MAQVNIKIEGLDKLRAGFKRAPDVVRREVNKGIDSSLFILEARAKKESPVDSGTLRARHVTKTNRFRMIGELRPATKYARFVHEGTKPHWPPYYPGSALDRWSKRHGNIPPYLVARKISRKGTKANPWLERTVKAERRNVEKIIQRSVNQAIKKIWR